MSDYTHLPVPEGYRLVRRGYPKSGEIIVVPNTSMPIDGNKNLYRVNYNFREDTHNIVEKISTEEKPMMEIPKGWKFVANRPPLAEEWYVANNNKLTQAAIDWGTCSCDEECPLRGSKQTIVEPIIPSGWEFVDYRSPIQDEWYILGESFVVHATSLTEKYKGSRYTIVRKKETQVKPNLESYSYTPKVEPITPRDIYGSHLEKIPAILGDKWEIVDFRPVTCCDYYIGAEFYNISAYEPSYATSDIEKPRFIIRRLRKITDTERLEYLLAEGVYMNGMMNYLTKASRTLIDAKIREGEKKGN